MDACWQLRFTSDPKASCGIQVSIEEVKSRQTRPDLLKNILASLLNLRSYSKQQAIFVLNFILMISKPNLDEWSKQPFPLMCSTQTILYAGCSIIIEPAEQN